VSRLNTYAIKLFSVILVLAFLSNCTKDLPETSTDNQFVHLDPEQNIKRVTQYDQYIPLRTIKSQSQGADETLAFNLRYMIEAPLVNGQLVQASHLSYRNGQLYLSYNTAGEIIRGAYEIITLEASGMPNVLTSGALTSEYHSVDVVYDADRQQHKMLLAGIKLPFTGGTQSIVQVFDLNEQGLPDGSPVDVALKGVVATDVNHNGIVTGTNGHFYQLSGYTALEGNAFEDARSVAYYSNLDQYVALLGKPGRLAMNLSGQTQYIPLGGLDISDTKAMVRVFDDYAFAALGAGGLKVVDLSNGEIISELAKPDHPVGENELDYVTNSVSVNGQGLVFIANGAAGIYVARFHSTRELELLGFLDMDASVNHVEASGNYLFAACGDRGVAIIELTGMPEGVPIITTHDIAQPSIESNTVTVNGWIGNVLPMDIAESGVCWSIERNPSTDDRVMQLGKNVGDFEVELDQLQAETIYYVRTFVRVESGETYYSNQVIFRTLDDGDTTPSFTDARDGRRYKTVTIGNQTWMAENLAWLPAVSPAGSGSTVEPFYYVNDYNGFIVEQAKQKTNYLRYGVLYNWTAAQTACPDGWHLPTDVEWQAMEQHLGMTAPELNQMRFRLSGQVGGQLKSVAGWYQNLNGNGNAGFHAKPAGYREKGGSYKYTESFTGFWSSNENDSYGLYRGLYYFNDGVYRGNWYKSAAFSVRCVEN